MTSEPDATDAAVNPWEEREDRGYVRAFAETAWAVVRRPRRLFGATRPSRGLRDPLFFGVVAATLGFAVEAVVFTLTSLVVPGALPEELASEAPIVVGEAALASMPQWALSALGCQAAFLASPLIVAAYALLLLLWAAVVHLGVVVMGRGGEPAVGFAGSLAAVGYTETLMLAQFVPFLGDVVLLVGAVPLTAVGLQEIHGTSRGRSFLIAALPFLLVLLVGLALLVARAPGAAA